MMKVPVNQIPSNYKTVEVKTPVEWVQNACQNAILGDWMQCDGVMVLKKHQERVIVEIEVDFKVECGCDRCGDHLLYSDQIRQHLVYVPDVDLMQEDFVKYDKHAIHSEKVVQEVLLGDDDLDVGWYADGVLDLDVVLTEAILLIKPSLLICDQSKTKRVDEGTCRDLPTEGQKNTHKPFAGLDFLE